MGSRRVVPCGSRCADGFEDIALPRNYSRSIRLVAGPEGSQKRFQLRNSFFVLGKHSSLISFRRPVPKCKRGAVGPFISAGEWSYRPTCKYRARVMWAPQLGAQSIKFGLKGAGDLRRNCRKRGNWKNRDWSFEEKLNRQMKGLR